MSSQGTEQAPTTPPPGFPFSLFTVLIRYIRPMEEVEKVVGEHRSYLEGIYQSGTLLASGPLIPRTGGILWLKAGSRREIERIVQADPYNRRGVATFEILEFAPKKLVPGFES
ncbi:MAG: YciI family protein [Leptospirales bacterium]